MQPLLCSYIHFYPTLGRLKPRSHNERVSGQQRWLNNYRDKGQSVRSHHRDADRYAQIFPKIYIRNNHRFGTRRPFLVPPSRQLIRNQLARMRSQIHAKQWRRNATFVGATFGISPNSLSKTESHLPWFLYNVYNAQNQTNIEVTVCDERATKTFTNVGPHTAWFSLTQEWIMQSCRSGNTKYYTRFAPWLRPRWGS